MRAYVYPPSPQELADRQLLHEFVDYVRRCICAQNIADTLDGMADDFINQARTFTPPPESPAP